MKVGVIGLGKLGLPMACVLAESGCDVVGIDQDAMTVAVLQRGECTICEPEVPGLLTKHAARMRFDTDPSLLAGCEVVFIVTATPSDATGAFSAQQVEEAAQEAMPYLTPDALLVVISTVMPGAMSRLRRLVDCRLAYNPRFIALGTVVRDMRNPDFVLVGVDNESDGARLGQFYRDVMRLTAPLHIMDFDSAEVAKLALNCYVTMKISYANSLAELCDALGADVLKIVDAIGCDHRVGRAYLSPGAAYGGTCFPRDDRAYLRAADLAGVTMPLTEAARDVNEWQTQRIVHECIGADAQRVAVLGLAFKPGTPVTEESAGWCLYLELEDTEGFEARCHDPLARPDGVKIYPLADLLEWADTVCIMTPWPEYRGLDLTGKHLIDPWRLYHEYV
jgi:UDPglucose 6-dehydrogenase